MVTMIAVWWHDRVLRHVVQERTVHLPEGPIGRLYRCTTEGCGKVWVR